MWTLPQKNRITILSKVLFLFEIKVILIIVFIFNAGSYNKRKGNKSNFRKKMRLHENMNSFCKNPTSSSCNTQNTYKNQNFYVPVDSEDGMCKISKIVAW